MLLEAARIEDPIEHSKGWLAGALGALAGLVVGVLLVAAIIFFAPAAAAIIGAIGLISLGLGMVSLGKELGDRFFKKKFEAERKVVGDIGQGSPDTTIGSRELFAARVTDKVKCHRGKVVATGVKEITINKLPASRKDEKTQCLGKILKGCPTVLYGGESSEFPALVKLDNDEAVPDWLFFTYEALDIANLVLSVISLRGMLKPGALASASRLIRGWKLFDLGHSGVDLALGGAMKGMEGGYAELWGRATDNYQYSAAQQSAAVTQTDGYKNFKFGWQLFGTAKSLTGVGMARYEGRVKAAEASGGSSGGGGGSETTPNTTRLSPAADAQPLPTTTRVEAAPATPPAGVPPTTRVDPPGWADTAKNWKAEREGRVELPEWHDRMVGSRGD